MVEEIKTKKQRKGITLVSLVITIIVLLILAGITISLTVGEEGIISIAKKAKENILIAQAEEENMLNDLYTQMSSEIAGSTLEDLNQFKKTIAQAITQMGVETSETANSVTMANNIKSIVNNGNASTVNYDNSKSELTSTTIQDAIDELSSNINELKTDLNRIIYVTVANSKTQSLPTGYSTIEVSPPTVSGYTALRMISAQSNSTADVWVTHNGWGGCRVYNNSGAVRANFYLNTSWLMIKDEFYQ